MKTFKNFLKNLMHDESAQGATEYILLLVVVVAIIVLFKGQIQQQINGLIGQLSGKISQVTSP